MFLSLACSSVDHHSVEIHIIRGNTIYELSYNYNHFFVYFMVSHQMYMTMWLIIQVNTAAAVPNNNNHLLNFHSCVLQALCIVLASS